jgi:Flp pilus assembly pilin Flp
MPRSVKRRRRGASAIQVAMVMVLVAVGVIASVSSIGQNTDVEMTDTAGRVGDPSSLPGKFASDYAPSGGGGTSGDGDTGDTGGGGFGY